MGSHFGRFRRALSQEGGGGEGFSERIENYLLGSKASSRGRNHRVISSKSLVPLKKERPLKDAYLR